MNEDDLEMRKMHETRILMQLCWSTYFLLGREVEHPPDEHTVRHYLQPSVSEAGRSRRPQYVQGVAVGGERTDVVSEQLEERKVAHVRCTYQKAVSTWKLIDSRMGSGELSSRKRMMKMR